MSQSTIKKYVIQTDTIKDATQDDWDISQYKLQLISASLRCNDKQKLIEAFRTITKT